jgi:hypothetical protein
MEYVDEARKYRRVKRGEKVDQLESFILAVLRVAQHRQMIGIQNDHLLAGIPLFTGAFAIYFANLASFLVDLLHDLVVREHTQSP